jgi:hypothetical protein
VSLGSNFPCTPVLTIQRREIASKSFAGGADTKSQRPFPRFLVKLSELCPRLVHKQMVVLQQHLESEVGRLTCHNLISCFILTQVLLH